MTKLNIVPECEVDTRLVQILADITKRPNYQKGNGNVANKMLFENQDFYVFIKKLIRQQGTRNNIP